MQNELHDRLEYLVNYSSQLIFVSGDSIANQQRTLETFVYQQHDETEIAYLTADVEMNIADYRRQLCRQLLGQVVGSFVRPLNELLSELNTHEGPVLIAITQAQHMPDSLLQELWDLVLQSRFAGNKQHLNVLLFGEPAWAERAKQWLPSKNTDTPLLISSQSVHADTGGGSELDKLIAKRREEFQAHLTKRASLSSPRTLNLVSSRWFIGFMLLLFVAIFGGLITWQYGDDIRALFSPIKSQPERQTSPAPGDAFADLLDDDKAGAVDESNVAEKVKATSDPQNDTADTLVADWPDRTTKKQQNAPQTAVQTPTENNAVQPKQTGKQQVSDGAVTLTATEETQTTPPPEEQNRPEVSVDEAPEPENNTTPRSEVLTTDATRLLEQVRPSDFYIQMAGLSDKALLSQFINDNSLRDLTHVYRTFRYGGDWFVVLFHQPFTTPQQAKSAMQQLPDYQGRAKAFVKNGSQIRQELTTRSPSDG